MAVSSHSWSKFQRVLIVNHHARGNVRVHSCGFDSFVKEKLGLSNLDLHFRGHIWPRYIQFEGESIRRFIYLLHDLVGDLGKKPNQEGHKYTLG